VAKQSRRAGDEEESEEDDHAQNRAESAVTTEARARLVAGDRGVVPRVRVAFLDAYGHEAMIGTVE